MPTRNSIAETQTTLDRSKRYDELLMAEMRRHHAVGIHFGHGTLYSRCYYIRLHDFGIQMSTWSGANLPFVTNCRPADFQATR